VQSPSLNSPQTFPRYPSFAGYSARSPLSLFQRSVTFPPFFFYRTRAEREPHPSFPPFPIYLPPPTQIKGFQLQQQSEKARHRLTRSRWSHLPTGPHLRFQTRKASGYLPFQIFFFPTFLHLLCLCCMSSYPSTPHVTSSCPLLNKDPIWRLRKDKRLRLLG